MTAGLTWAQQLPQVSSRLALARRVRGVRADLLPRVARAFVERFAVRGAPFVERAMRYLTYW